MNSGQIVALVIGCVVVLFFLGYWFVSWYTWRKVQRLNPNVPRVKVDLKEYQGRWYEIARYDQWFSKGCGATTANYGINNDGTVSVTNTCQTSTGKQVAEGTAYPTKHDGVLGVSFFPGVYGNYTVTYRDPKTSIVTNQDKSALWILSRSPKISTQKQQRLERWLKDHKFNTNKLIYTGPK